MRKLLITLAMAAFALAPALGKASVSISLNLVQYPALQRIPGYPVYYAPHLHANYFFYDGLYWTYVGDAWYASPWYDGPWDFVAIDSVPLFVLRVPVRYYVYPPAMFSGWAMNAPPRWDRVWGPDWARRHNDWQRWNRSSVPAPAPLPRYQQRYTRANYPNEAQRRELSQQHYRYAPRDSQVRQRSQEHATEMVDRPHERPRPERQSQTQLAPRPAESRHHETRPVEHENAQPNRHSQQREAPVVQHERPPMRAEPPRAEEREFSRNARPEHGGRPDKADRSDKSDKDEGHGPGKHR